MTSKINDTDYLGLKRNSFTLQHNTSFLHRNRIFQIFNIGPYEKNFAIVEYQLIPSTLTGVTEIS